MADRVIKFRGEFDASQILVSLKQIRSEMEKSGASPDLFKSIDKDIEKAEGMVKELTVQINNGFKNTRELDAFGKKFDAFGKLCSKVELGLKDVNKAANFKISDSSLDQLKADLEEVQKKENDAAKTSASAIANLKNITAKMRQELTQAADDGDKLEEVYTKLANQNFAKGQSTLNKVMANTGGLSDKQISKFGEDKQGMFTTADGGQKYAETLYKIATTSITVKEAFDELKQSLNEQDQELIESDSFIESYIEDLKELANEAAKDKTQYKGSITKAINTMTTLGTAAPSGSFVSNSKETEQIADQMQLMQQKHALQEQINQKEKAMSAQAKAAQDKFTTGLANATEQQKQLADATNQSAEATKQQIESQKSLDEAFDKIGNIVKQVFSLSTAWRQVRRVITATFQDVKQLDKSFGEIAMVTKYSVADMWGQYNTYAAMANKLGQATKSVVDASSLFYQQGLDTNEVLQLTEDTMKLATLAGLDFKEATSQMTAALRAFHLEMDQGAHVTDVYAELAAHAAASVNDISQAMSATASIAHSAGMSFENTAAMLTTMIEATQEAPKNLGTAMKAILARFTELKDNVAGTAQSEFDDLDYNKVDKALKSVGITIKDANGQFRNMDDVLLELSGKWNTLDRNSQRYIATIAAGSRQQSRFIALMENYERTMQLVGVAEDSAGKSSEQFAKNQDTIEYKLNRMKNAWEQTRTSFLESGFYKDVIDNITSIISKVKNLNIGKLIGIGAIALTIGKSFAKDFINGAKTIVNGAQSIGMHFKNKLNQSIASKTKNKFDALKTEVELDIKVNEDTITKAEARIQELKTAYTELNRDNQDIVMVEARKKGLLNDEAWQQYITDLDRAASASEHFEAAQRALGIQIIRSEKEIENSSAAIEKDKGNIERLGVAANNTANLVGQGIKSIAGSIAVGIGAMLATDNFEDALDVMGKTLLASAISIGTSFISTAIATGTAAGVGFREALKLTGGPVVVGITVAIAAIYGLIQAIKAIGSHSKSLDENIDSLEKYQESLQSAVSELKNKKKENEDEIKTLKELKEKYDELSNKIALSTEEQEEYSTIVEQLKEGYPELITFYDEENGRIELSNKLTEERIKLLEEETEALRIRNAAAEYTVIETQNKLEDLLNTKKLATTYGFDETVAGKLATQQNNFNYLITEEDIENTPNTSEGIYDLIGELLGDNSSSNAQKFLKQIFGNEDFLDDGDIKAEYIQDIKNLFSYLINNIDYEDLQITGASNKIAPKKNIYELKTLVTQEAKESERFNDKLEYARTQVADQYKNDKTKTATDQYIEAAGRAAYYTNVTGYKEAATTSSPAGSEDYYKKITSNEASEKYKQDKANAALQGMDIADTMTRITEKAYRANDWSAFQKELEDDIIASTLLDNLQINSEEAFNNYFQGRNEAQMGQSLGEIWDNAVSSYMISTEEIGDALSDDVKKESAKIIDDIDDMTIEDYNSTIEDIEDILQSEADSSTDKEKIEKQNENYIKAIKAKNQKKIENATKEIGELDLDIGENTIGAISDYYDDYNKYVKQYTDNHANENEDEVKKNAEEKAKEFVKTMNNQAKVYASSAGGSTAQNVIRDFKWEDILPGGETKAYNDFKRQMKEALGADYDETKVKQTFDSMMKSAKENSVGGIIKNATNAEEVIDNLEKIDTAIDKTSSKIKSIKEDYIKQGTLTTSTIDDLKDVISELNTAGMGLDLEDYKEFDETTGKIVFKYDKLREDIKNFTENTADQLQARKDEVKVQKKSLEEQLKNKTLTESEKQDLLDQIDALDKEYRSYEEQEKKLKEIETRQNRIKTIIEEQLSALQNMAKAYQTAITKALGNKGIIAASDLSELKAQLDGQDVLDYVDSNGKLNISKLKEYYEKQYKKTMSTPGATDEEKLQAQLIYNEFMKEYEELTDLTKAEREDAKAKLELKQANDNLAEAQEELIKKQKEYNEALYGSEKYRQPLDDLYNYTTALDRLSSAATRAKNALDNMMDGDNAKELLQQYYDSTREQIKFLQAENIVRQQAIANAQQTLQNDLNKELAKNGMQNIDASQLYTNINGRYDLDLNKLNSLGINDSFRDFIANTVSSMNDLQKGIDDNNDAIRAKQKEALDYKKTINKNYVALEDDMKNALKDKYQQEIDDLQAKYDAMESADSDYLNSLEEAINKQRELRDKANKWDDLATKEKKLTLMQRDTSGANALEVQKLEKEVQNDRQTLLDEGIDEVIKNLKELYDLQKEERDLEIEYRESLLTDAQLLAEITEALEGIHTADDLVNWYSNITDWSGKSTANIEQMKTDWKDSFQALDTYRASSFIDFENAFTVTSQEIQQTVATTSETLTTKIKSELTTTSEAVEKAIKDAGKAITDQQLSIISLQQSVTDLGKASETASAKLEVVKNLLENIDLSNLTELGPGEVSISKLDELIPNGSEMSLDDKLSYLTKTGMHGYVMDNNTIYIYDDGEASKILPGLGWNVKKFAKGGFADYTGPAWVDGSPSAPEAFLNSEDTRRIGEAAKLLADLPALNGNISQNISTSTVGDTTIALTVNFDSISEEYDAERVIDLMKQKIVEAAHFAGSNVILQQ